MEQSLFQRPGGIVFCELQMEESLSWCSISFPDIPAGCLVPQAEVGG